MSIISRKQPIRQIRREGVLVRLSIPHHPCATPTHLHHPYTNSFTSPTPPLTKPSHSYTTPTTPLHPIQHYFDTTPTPPPHPPNATPTPPMHHLDTNLHHTDTAPTPYLHHPYTHPYTTQHHPYTTERISAKLEAIVSVSIIYRFNSRQKGMNFESRFVSTHLMVGMTFSLETN